MHRRSSRRALLSILACAAFFLLVINLRVETEGPLPWLNLTPLDVGRQETVATPAETTVAPGKPDDERRTFDLGHLAGDDTTIPEMERRPWYMEGGQLRPDHCVVNPESGKCNVTIWPEEKRGDRLRDQLMFFPPKDSIAEHQEDVETPLKKILFWNGASSWGIRPGRGIFIKEQCPVSSCVIATNRRESKAADLIVFKDHFTMPGMDRRREQIWMIFMLESPLHTQVFKHKGVFNWTATYRSVSSPGRC